MARLPSVLLVDDDATSNFLSRLLIERAGITDHVVIAQNGLEALALVAAKQCPALILLDLNMPVMNGLEFLEAYQHLPISPPQPVIVLLTTSVLPRELEQLQQLPITSRLVKPLTREKIQQLVDQHFPAVTTT
jgi:CheY-like chemotaxis protein